MPDKQTDIFDNSLSEISTLNWLPSVGWDYEKTRLLLLGDSFYDDGDEWLDDRFAIRHLINNKGMNSNNPVFSGAKILRIIEKTVLSQSEVNFEERKNFWASVSFCNLVQRLMSSRKERPNYDDYDSGWKTILEVANIMKPKVCIKFGIAGKGRLGYYLNNNNTDWIRNVDEFYMRPCIINLQRNDYHLKIIFINHPTGSYGFNYKKWSDVINDNEPNLINSIINRAK